MAVRHGHQRQQSEADALTRKFARVAGVGITDATVIAIKEAITRRRAAESPLETAERPGRSMALR